MPDGINEIIDYKTKYEELEIKIKEYEVTFLKQNNAILSQKLEKDKLNKKLLN